MDISIFKFIDANLEVFEKQKKVARRKEMFLMVYFLLFSMTIYPPCALFHLHSPPPWSSKLLSVSMSSFFFFFLISPSSSFPRAVSLLSIYESVSILCVSSVCSLDSIYEWNQSSIDGHLSYFHILAIVNNTADICSTGMHTSFWIHVLDFYR